MARKRFHHICEQWKGTITKKEERTCVYQYPAVKKGLFKTSPIPRKTFEMMLSRRPRPTLDPVSSKPEQLEVSVSWERAHAAVSQMQIEWSSSGFKEESKRIFMDLDVIRKCNDCPYIVKCYGYIITFENLYICMEVMATCLDKLLQQRKSGIPEHIIGKITLSVVQALDYLKENHKIMHRLFQRCETSNILLDWYGNVKLCDFGISGKLIDSKAITMSAGCAAYLAPERIHAESGYGYDVRADVWSLGITLVQLATGQFPYQSSTPFELMVKIREEQPPLLSPSNGFSQEFCDFIKDCLQKDMAERPKFKDLMDKPFLVRSQTETTDVGQWYQAEYQQA
uniref:Protein kinase domain-containing protein n=1 Tax=Ditylenchus dipsaci TaxID=166011 RepID=A0A915D6L3_9BILA